MKVIIIDDEDLARNALRFILARKYSDDEIVDFYKSDKFLRGLPTLDLSAIDYIFLDHNIGSGTNGEGVRDVIVEIDPLLKNKIFSISNNTQAIKYVDESHIIGKPPRYFLAGNKEKYLKENADEIYNYCRNFGFNLNSENNELGFH